jgi:hypothetical protein
MAFKLEELVPWGRSFGEYVSMFALSGDDLGKKSSAVAMGRQALTAPLQAVEVRSYPSIRFIG